MLPMLPMSRDREIRHLIKEGVSLLQEYEMQEARLSSEVLLAYTLDMDRCSLYRDSNQVISTDLQQRYFQFIDQRKRGKPTAYLIKEKEFYSLSFFVDDPVLIPRPETEILVEAVLFHLSGMNCVHPRICDVGTGSGVIAVTLKKYIPNSHVVAIDKHLNAMHVARENSRKHDVDISFVLGDLLQSVSSEFDCVVANLPYIPSEEIKSLAKDVCDFEPVVALDGGKDGLELIKQLIHQASRLVKKNGILALEYGKGQLQTIQEFLQKDLFQVISTHKDLSGISRVVVAVKE